MQTVARNPKAVFSSLSAFGIRYNVPVVWIPTPELAARQIERWCWWWWRERVKLYQHVPACEI